MATKQYKKLNRYESYDVEAVEELAEALNEITTAEARVRFLKELVEENKELHKFVWRTAEGVSIAFQKIEDDHFKNILQHLTDHGRKIPKSLRAEAERRGVPLPVTAHVRLLNGSSIEVDAFDDDLTPDEWEP